ncbi:hypothetical protein D3C80_1345080 [compost metagenome]
MCSVHAGERAGNDQFLYCVRGMTGHLKGHHAPQGQADQLDAVEPEVVQQRQYFQSLGMGGDAFGGITGCTVP